MGIIAGNLYYLRDRQKYEDEIDRWMSGWSDVKQDWTVTSDPKGRHALFGDTILQYLEDGRIDPKRWQVVAK